MNDSFGWFDDRPLTDQFAECGLAASRAYRGGRSNGALSGMFDTVVSYEGGLRCRAEHADSGAVVLTDMPKDIYGKGESFSPNEMLSISLGSCILSIMGIAARAMNIDIVGATATVTREMDNAPRRIAQIAVTVRVPGSFDDRQRAKLEATAHACPVHNVLGIEAPIKIDWIG